MSRANLKCEYSLLQPVFMFLDGQQTLVAVLIITAAKEDVRQSNIQSDNVHVSRRSMVDGQVKQAQETVVRV